MNKNLTPILKELHKAFDLLNKEYYNNELPQVIIAIRSQGNRKGVMGWFTPAKVWEVGETEKHEIVITAETLNRDFMDIMRTLHHEMIHLYCEENEIKDTSRGGSYHNGRFKSACLEHGFYYAIERPCSRIGWSGALLTDHTMNTIESWNIDKTVFNVVRKSFGNSETTAQRKSNIIKWVCPSCKDIIRSSKPNIKAYCMNDENEDNEPCAVMFEPED